MQTVRGDLLALAIAGDFDVIIHGCNCLHTMSAGIAKSIKHQFPAAYDADLATEKGSRVAPKDSFGAAKPQEVTGVGSQFSLSSKSSAI